MTLATVIALHLASCASGDGGSKGDSPGPSTAEFTDDAVVLSTEKDDAVQVHFVINAAADSFPELAQACLDSFLSKGYQAVNCYGFDSDEAFEYAAPSETFGQGMEHVCWRAFAADTKDRNAPRAAVNDSFDAEGCPPPVGADR